MSINVAKRHATNTGTEVDYQHKLAEEVVASRPAIRCGDKC